MIPQIVLMYHDVYRDSPYESGFDNITAIKYKIDVVAFEEHVAWIDGYLRKYKLSTDMIDFTFDDGGETFLTVIAPILEKYGFKGKFYITTDYIGTKGFLNANQIKELKVRGHIIGNHSHSHPERMSALSAEEIKNEWHLSQMILREILGETSLYASIPNGYQSKEVLSAMTSVGIKFIDTSTPLTRSSHFNGATIRGRYVITDDIRVDDLMRLVISPMYRIKKSLRWKVFSVAKWILGDSYLKIRENFAK